jgi:hypothetical protein
MLKRSPILPQMPRGWKEPEQNRRAQPSEAQAIVPDPVGRIEQLAECSTWQPALVAGLELGVFGVTARTRDVVRRLTKDDVGEVDIRKRLDFAATYLDDEHWAANQERDLGFELVRLTNVGRFTQDFGITLQVSGDGASLNEPRLVSLVRQARAYRKTKGAVILVGETIRLAVKLGEPIWAKSGEQTLCTLDTIDLDDLAELERQGVSFDGILVSAEQAAS